jgi:predicted Zn-dependent peptidase
MSVELTRLSNGLMVATHAMPHLESAAIVFWVDAGARSESPREHGISHLLEHMAFKGTGRRSARDIAEEIEAVGGEINAETSVDHTSYYVRVLKEDIALGMDVLGDVLGDPLLDPEELQREKHVIIQEIGAAHDVPDDWVFELFQEAAFPGQAIGRSILGTHESIESHTADDLRRFLGKHYCGSQSVIAAAGRLDHDEIVRLAERHFGALPAHAPPKTEPGLYKGGGSVQPRALQEAQILIGFAAPSYTDKAFIPAYVFTSILGGGMASRLFQELRENRGLCYSIHSFYWPFADTGVFGIHAATSEDDIEELMPVIVEEVQKMAAGVTDAELRRAKAQMRSGLMMLLESPLGRARQMARHARVHGRLLSLAEMVARVDAVTQADMQALAVNLLESYPTLAAIGPIAPLPLIGDFAAELAGRKSAVGW